MSGKCIHQCLITMATRLMEGGGTMLEETMVITTTTRVAVTSVVVVVVAAADHTEGGGIKTSHPEDQVFVNTWSLFLLNCQSGFHQSVKFSVEKKIVSFKK